MSRQKLREQRQDTICEAELEVYTLLDSRHHYLVNFKPSSQMVTPKLIKILIFTENDGENRSNKFQSTISNALTFQPGLGHNATATIQLALPYENRQE